jgi:hypothetical protein
MTFWIKKNSNGKTLEAKDRPFIQQAIDAGKLGPDDLISKTSNGPWKRLSAVKGLVFSDHADGDDAYDYGDETYDYGDETYDYGDDAYDYGTLRNKRKHSSSSRADATSKKTADASRKATRNTEVEGPDKSNRLVLFSAIGVITIAVAIGVAVIVMDKNRRTEEADAVVESAIKNAEAWIAGKSSETSEDIIEALQRSVRNEYTTRQPKEVDELAARIQNKQQAITDAHNAWSAIQKDLESGDVEIEELRNSLELYIAMPDIQNADEAASLLGQTQVVADSVAGLNSSLSTLAELPTEELQQISGAEPRLDQTVQDATLVAILDGLQQRKRDLASTILQQRAREAEALAKAREQAAKDEREQRAREAQAAAKARDRVRIAQEISFETKDGRTITTGRVVELLQNGKPVDFTASVDVKSTDTQIVVLEEASTRTKPIPISTLSEATLDGIQSYLRQIRLHRRNHKQINEMLKSRVEKYMVSRAVREGNIALEESAKQGERKSLEWSLYDQFVPLYLTAAAELDAKALEELKFKVVPAAAAKGMIEPKAPPKVFRWLELYHNPSLATAAEHKEAVDGLTKIKAVMDEKLIMTRHLDLTKKSKYLNLRPLLSKWRQPVC